MLERVAVAEDNAGSGEQDLDVIDPCNVGRVFDVAGHARGHRLYPLGGAPQAADLGKACDPWSHCEASRIAGYKRDECRVMSSSVWPWPDDGHRPIQDIDELRQLVEARAAQYSTHRSHAAVVMDGLSEGDAVFGDGHGAKLVYLERTFPQPVARLREENTAPAAEADRYSNRNKDGQQKNAERSSQSDIHRPLAVPRVERLGDRHDTAQLRHCHRLLPLRPPVHASGPRARRRQARRHQRPKLSPKLRMRGRGRNNRAEISQMRAAVVAVAVKRQGADAPAAGQRVNRVGKLDFTAAARAESGKHIKNLWMENIPSDGCQV